MDTHDPATDKFVALMRNLTHMIAADSSHQQTIYECLNSEEIRRLFESIHDDNANIRITGINFLCHLLHNNARIVELISLLQGHQQPPGLKKVTTTPTQYILGGLNHYHLPQPLFKRILSIKQPETIINLQKVKYQPDALAWAIDLKNNKIHYHTPNKLQQLDPFPFDPNHCIVGVFVKTDDTNYNEQERKINTVNGSRYKISKK